MGCAVTRDRKKRIPKKLIHDVRLPSELRNDWDGCLRSSGLDVQIAEIPIPRPPADPAGFSRKSAYIAFQDMVVGTSSWWDVTGECYVLTIGFEDVQANLPLARKIEDVLVLNGASALSEQLETLENALKKPR